MENPREDGEQEGKRQYPTEYGDKIKHSIHSERIMLFGGTLYFNFHILFYIQEKCWVQHLASVNKP
jgi:hypothetical protein